MRRTICIAAVSVALAGCAAGAPTTAPAVSPPGSPAAEATASAGSVASPGEPSGMIAIGHSGLTGEGTGSVPEAAPENSWATGSNPDVNSVYLRLKEAHPELAGIAVNQAHGGANADELPGMAERALSSVPAPALAIIQTIDNDIRCDGTDAAHVQEFGASVAKAIETITGASPDSKVLVVGQLGRPSIPFIKTLVAHDPSVVGPLEEGGRCAFLDADGKPIPANFAYLTSIIDAYDAEQARVCAEFPQCRTDGGVRAAYVDTLENFSPDWNHLNVKGQAAEAALIWPVVSALFAP